jgi:hypothetical protein
MRLINLLQVICGIVAVMCIFCAYAVHISQVQPDLVNLLSFFFAVVAFFMFTLIWDERRRLKEDISYCEVANRICDACLSTCKKKGRVCPPH